MDVLICLSLFCVCVAIILLHREYKDLERLCIDLMDDVNESDNFIDDMNDCIDELGIEIDTIRSNRECKCKENNKKAKKCTRTSTQSKN